MKIFTCQRCGQRIYFENVLCERCGADLAYLPDRQMVAAVTAAPDGGVAPLGSTEGGYRRCANAQYGACNWLIEPGDDHGFCRACRLNRIIPDLSVPANVLRWQRIELAKHRAVHNLLRLGLPVKPKAGDAPEGIAFEFLSDEAAPAPVMTGHAGGVITLNIVEADDAQREARRLAMHEPYRTLLGHFRHELGHYYWERLIENTPRVERYRALFGDEREDYGQALQRHYDAGPPPDWRERFISAYASAHPWEDWAECWAHYMHMVSTLDTATNLRLAVIGVDAKREIGSDAYRCADFEALLDTWYPLTEAVNALNRSMGVNDPYPFVVNTPTTEKLAFIHAVIHESRATAAAAGPGTAAGRG